MVDVVEVGVVVVVAVGTSGDVVVTVVVVVVVVDVIVAVVVEVVMLGCSEFCQSGLGKIGCTPGSASGQTITGLSWPLISWTWATVAPA